MRKRRSLGFAVVFAAALSGLLVTASASGTVSQSNVTSKVKTVYSGPIIIANALAVAPQLVPALSAEEGFFAANGLPNVTVSTVGTTAIESAVGSNAIQFGVLGSPDFDLAAVNGANITVLSAFGRHVNTDLVVPADIKTLSQLKGTKIAEGGPSDESSIFVHQSVLEGGLKYSDVTFVPINGVAASIAAFENGEVQAVDESPPSPAQIIAQDPGAHIIENYLHKFVWPNAELVGNSVWVKTHKAATIAMLKALNEGLIYWRHHPSTAEQLIEKQSGETVLSQLQFAYQAATLAFTKSLETVTIPEEEFVLKSLRQVGFGQADNFLASRIDQPQYLEKAVPGSNVKANIPNTTT